MQLVAAEIQTSLDVHLPIQIHRKHASGILTDVDKQLPSQPTYYTWEAEAGLADRRTVVPYKISTMFRLKSC